MTADERAIAICNLTLNAGDLALENAIAAAIRAAEVAAAERMRERCALVLECWDFNEEAKGIRNLKVEGTCVVSR